MWVVGIGLLLALTFALGAKGRPPTHEFLYGDINPLLICPHCQKPGLVRAKTLMVKAGISGGKATAAILTAGISLLLTGLSREEEKTQAHCDRCDSTWQF